MREKKQIRGKYKKLSREIEKKIYATFKSNPNLHYKDLAAMFGINQSRVGVVLTTGLRLKW